MKAVEIKKNGGPEVLELKDITLNKPDPDQITIEQKAIGLNYIDTYHRSGLYPLKMPSGIGLEGAGVITEVGENVKDFKIGDKSCLKCHQNGGYVAKFKAYTPVVPHPEKVNCRQCHVTENTSGLFKPANAEVFIKPKIGNAEFIGGPPIISHQIQLHENCLACHAGPSAPKEIRIDHPERSNCRQCHVVNNKEITDIGVFTRKK